MNIRSGINWTKLAIALSLMCSVLGFSATAQTKPDNPLDEEGLAALVEKLKVSLAEVIEEEETQTSITGKWDQRFDSLIGKTTKQVVDLLLADVKSVVKDAEKVNQLKVSFIAATSDSELTGESEKTEPKETEAKEKTVDEPKNTTQPNSNTTSATRWDDCPPFPSALAGVLRWEALRVPNLLFCRALLTDSGAEAFALTISPESLFKPVRSDRAESARLNGRELFWYRVKLPNQPNVEARETLIPIAEDRVVHVSVRANDAQTLSRYQKYVLSLPFPNYVE